MKKELNRRILKFITEKGVVGASFTTLTKEFKDKKVSKGMIDSSLRYLIKDRKVKFKEGIYLSVNTTVAKKEAVSGVILRVKETFGIARIDETQQEVFIPGRSLMGGLPNEKVLLSKLYSVTHDDAFEVVEIVERLQNPEFVGTVKRVYGRYFVQPEQFVQFPIAVAKQSCDGINDGDKVLARVLSRGARHSDMTVDIVNVYGDSQKAAICAMAVLDLNGISPIFPQEVLDEANLLSKKGITEKDLRYREDYRQNTIFTIDSADSKDLDDAVSIEKIGDYYILGVHIADVSHYVRQESYLDKEAYHRGTSVYYANRVVPMLPPSLSNGICSLNPNEDRLTFSIIMTLDLEGSLVDFDIQKSIINSCIKGVYSEINDILHGSADEYTNEKYSFVKEKLLLMDELADILIARKRLRGAPSLDKAESKVILNKEDICINVVPRTRGKSECIIEEFMLMANQSAALAAKLRQIPFVYRVHEPPAPKKVETLKEALKILGLETTAIRSKLPVGILSQILSEATPSNYNVLNNILLRTMSKAVYSADPIGHYGLALDDYAHFTSPIRRYPDLAIHRILSDLLACKDERRINKRYKEFAVKASAQSSQTELTAMQVERASTDCYKAEYMKAHIGECYKAVITGAMGYGMYVELDNTVEGLIRFDGFPDGQYELANPFEIRETLSGKSYKTGDVVEVVCTSADVSTGRIGFEIANR